MPKVSIVLTSFNHSKYIREAIESVLNQTFADFELIIWDDASSDNSWEIIQSYQDPRIRAFRNHEQKRGIYGINKAISEVALGEYIAIHHSDDIWDLDKLEKQVAFLDGHPDIGAVFTNALIIDEDGQEFQDSSHFYFSIFNQENRTRHKWLRRFFEYGNALCHPSVLIRKRCYSDCGLYRYGLAQVGDFDMWIRLCLRYEIHVLPEKLILFRVRANEANTSGNRPDTRSRGHFESYLLLFNYLKIDKVDDLFKVFPEAQKYYNGDESLIQFSLAMAMLDIRPHDFVAQFALQHLFDLLNDASKSKPSTFGVNEFVKLTGSVDPLQFLSFERLHQEVANLLQVVSEVTSQNMHLRQAIDGCDAELRKMKSSRSWKLTAPFRGIGRACRAIVKLRQ